MPFLSQDITFIIFPQGGLIQSLDPIDLTITEIKIFAVRTSAVRSKTVTRSKRTPHQHPILRRGVGPASQVTQRGSDDSQSCHLSLPRHGFRFLPFPPTSYGCKVFGGIDKESYKLAGFPTP